MSDKTLKHISTGKCLHTSGGWPGNGRTLVLWSGCEAERLQIWFVKQGNNINYNDDHNYNGNNSNTYDNDTNNDNNRQ